MSINPVTDTDFATAVLGSDGPVLVDFSASWCGPCKQLARPLAQAADKLSGTVQVVSIDVDDAPITASTYRIQAVPTLILFDRGQPVANVRGRSTPSLVSEVTGLVAGLPD